MSHFKVTGICQLSLLWEVSTDRKHKKNGGQITKHKHHLQDYKEPKRKCNNQDAVKKGLT
jgi:hypothetical protein